MSKICEKCGKKPVAGKTYARRGLAKAKGGVGRKITGKTNPRFSPNIQVIRVREPIGTVRRMRVCAKCLKTGLRDGTITKATRKPRPPKETAPAPEPVVSPALEHDGSAPVTAPQAGGAMSASFAGEIDSAYDEEKDTEQAEGENPPDDQPTWQTEDGSTEGDEPSDGPAPE